MIRKRSFAVSQKLQEPSKYPYLIQNNILLERLTAFKSFILLLLLSGSPVLSRPASNAATIVLNTPSTAVAIYAFFGEDAAITVMRAPRKIWKYRAVLTRRDDAEAMKRIDWSR